MKHGEMIDPGDEFNRGARFYCAACGLVHTSAFRACDGLRGGWPTAEMRLAQERTKFEAWARGGGLLHFDGRGDAEARRYRDRDEDMVWYGWMSAKGLQ